MRGDIIVGRLASGIGQGKHFTQLAWARSQFTKKLAIDPFPGTVNVIVDESEHLAVWNRLRTTPGVSIVNPDDGPHDCDAKCYRTTIEDRIEAAIVLPDVANYAPNLIELIAPINLRDTLGLNDGDELTLKLK